MNDDMTHDEAIRLLNTVHLGRPLKYKMACEFAIKALQRDKIAQGTVTSSGYMESIVRHTLGLDEKGNKI